MQTTAIESVLQRGLDEFRLADLRQRDLPDARAGMLRRRPPVWAAAVELLERKAESDPALHTLLAARSLTADLFHPDLSATWQQANQAMYDCVTAALSAAGATSLTLEGHLDRTPSLIAAGREITGSLDLEAGRPRRPAEVLAVVMGNIEAETFTVADPLPARILTPQTPLTSMVADLERPHLFVTVRATAGLLGNYTILAGDRPDGIVSAWARRTVVEPDGGRLVELLSLRDPPAPDDLAVPLVAVIPMSLLSDPDWFAWTRGSMLRSTAMLADVALAPYLDQWTAQPQTRLRYTFLRIQAFGRVVPFLVGTVETAGSTAWPLLLRPLSHAGVRVHKAALEERDPTRRILVEDASFLDARRDLLELCLAHLAGEEITFGPASRGRPSTAS